MDTLKLEQVSKWTLQLPSQSLKSNRIINNTNTIIKVMIKKKKIKEKIIIKIIKKGNG